MAKLTAERVLADAATLVNVWQANPDFSLGATTRADFEQAIADLQAALAAVAARRTELTGLMDVRDDHARTRSDLVTRVRSGVRAGYGPDSP